MSPLPLICQVWTLLNFVLFPKDLHVNLTAAFGTTFWLYSAEAQYCQELGINAKSYLKDGLNWKAVLKTSFLLFEQVHTIQAFRIFILFTVKIYFRGFFFKMWNCLSHTPYCGTHSQPRHVPQIGNRTGNPDDSQASAQPLSHTSKGAKAKIYFRL